MSVIEWTTVQVPNVVLRVGRPLQSGNWNQHACDDEFSVITDLHDFPRTLNEEPSGRVPKKSKDCVGAGSVERGSPSCVSMWAENRSELRWTFAGRSSFRSVFQIRDRKDLQVGELRCMARGRGVFRLVSGAVGWEMPGLACESIQWSP